MKATIKYVELGSIAEELDIESGDVLLAINDKPIVDIMDYLYYRDDEFLTMSVKKSDGQIWDLEIDKDIDEELGLVFENPIIDHARSCSNQCLFCFIDQMPKGMRKSLYFKDDDSRLSFMMGNFVTLTNMSDAIFQRMIDYRISPINISVHTVDEMLRIKLLGNRFAGKIKDRLSELNGAGIAMNGQVVLMPELNDGVYLDETIEFLSSLYPNMQSMAVVPVGLTKYREGLPKLKPVSQTNAAEVIAQIDRWQSQLKQTIGSRFVYAADEFYLVAQRTVPDATYYDDYVQIENGVGLIRKFLDQALAAIELADTYNPTYRPIVVTSTGAGAMMRQIQQALKYKFNSEIFELIEIKNHFFGDTITVSGLITAKDIISQVKNRASGRTVLLAEHMFNTDNVTLDDMTLNELQNELNSIIHTVKIDGNAFIDAVLGGNNE